VIINELDEGFFLLEFHTRRWKAPYVNYIDGQDSVKTFIGEAKEGMSLRKFTYSKKILVQRELIFLNTLYRNITVNLQMEVAINGGNNYYESELNLKIGGGKGLPLPVRIINKGGMAPIRKSEGQHWLDSERLRLINFISNC